MLSGLPQFSADLVTSGSSPAIRARLYVGDDQLRLDVPRRESYPPFVILYYDGGNTTMFMKARQGEQQDFKGQSAFRNLVTYVLAYRPAGKDSYCDGYPKFLEHLAKPQRLSPDALGKIKNSLKCEKLGEETIGNETAEKLKLMLPADFGGAWELKYVPLRRFAVSVEGSLSGALENVKFEPQPRKKFDLLELMK